MTKHVKLGNMSLKVEKQSFGQGGQGKVFKCWPKGDPSNKLVLKYIEDKDLQWLRTEKLAAKNLSGLSPAFAAPIIAENDGNGNILHLSPFVDGVSWEDDIPRPFPHLLEQALELASLLTLLDANGLSHGDLSENNIRITSEGAIYFIDFDGAICEDPDFPEPLTTGQRPMQAPELRNNQITHPNKYSDRFALATLLSMILTGRYPTDGMGDTPVEVDSYMTRGYTP